MAAGFTGGIGACNLVPTFAPVHAPLKLNADGKNSRRNASEGDPGPIGTPLSSTPK